MYIQMITISVLVIVCLLFLYVISVDKAYIVDRIIAVYGICLCLRYGWLQTQWLEISIKNNSAKSIEWSAHDISVTGFMLAVSLYILMNTKARD